MGPAPPAATKVKRRGEWPRSMEMLHGVEQVLLDQVDDPSSRVFNREPEGFGHCGADGLAGRLEVEIERPPG